MQFYSNLYKPIIITIDGTAASGKGTIVRGLKLNLDVRYKTLDAGLMYRALTYFYLEQGIDNVEKLKSTKNLEQKLNAELDMRFNSEGKIILNNKEIESLFLRGPDIDPYVANFGAIDEIKQFIVNKQKKIIQESSCGWILDGRCMGTAVAPQAEVKFYTDAPLLVRATRRHGDYVKAGNLGFSTEEIAIEIEKRDELDMNTNIAPLRKPHDAMEINTYHYSPEAVVQKALVRVKHMILQAGRI